MARKQRDYKAEYARRKQLERERSAREGRPFSLSRARGHVRDSTRKRTRAISGYNPEITPESIEEALEHRADIQGHDEPTLDDYAWIDSQLADGIALYRKYRRVGKRHGPGRARYDANGGTRPPKEYHIILFYH